MGDKETNSPIGEGEGLKSFVEKKKKFYFSLKSFFTAVFILFCFLFRVASNIFGNSATSEQGGFRSFEQKQT